MTHLSVNVNKLATLRNSRGKNNPDVVALARKILHYGAHGITVHPRPDGRHIRPPDVVALRSLVEEYNREGHGHSAEFNVEGYPSEDFIQLLEQNLPHQATLVPDPPEALTSNAGWDLVTHYGYLEGVIKRLKKAHIRVSLFIDPDSFDEDQKKALSSLMPDRIELYTEAFAEAYATPQAATATAHYVKAAEIATKLGIELNAGHDLNQDNLGYLLEQIPQIKEVSIGHALICEALEQGLEKTIRNYLAILHQP